MGTDKYSLKSCLVKGWNAFKSNPTVSVLGSFLLIIIIPISFPIFLQAPFIGSGTTLALNLVNRNAAVPDVFSGFRKFSLFMGVFWLHMLGIGVFAIPGGIGGYLILEWGSDALKVNPLAENVIPFVIGIVVVIISVIMWLILVVSKWLFVFFIVADDWNDKSILAAFKKSSTITKGNRVKLLLSFLLLWLFAISGAIIFFVGILVTTPIAVCAMASIYQELKTRQEASSRLGCT